MDHVVLLLSGRANSETRFLERLEAVCVIRFTSLGLFKGL